MRRLAAAVVIVAALAATAAAQTPAPIVGCTRAPIINDGPDSVVEGRPFSVLADQDGLNCEGQPTTLTAAACYFDSTLVVAAAIAPKAATPPAVNAYQLECQGPTTLGPGVHRVQVGASNVVGENRSDILTFLVTANDPVPPPPVNCVPGPWGPWLPVLPVGAPPREHRVRAVVTPAANGGAACELEEVRDIVIVPPPTGFCRYIKPGESVVQTLTLGTSIHGVNQIATQSTRWPVLLAWGFKITAEPLTKTTVDITAVCVGPK